MYKKILAIDTSMDGCSVSLLKNHDILHNSKVCKKNHTKEILPMIQTVLTELKLKINELDIVIFSKGPGYFTGIRLSFCIAKTFTIGNKLKIIGISTLAILAEQAWRKYNSKKVLVAIHANQKKIYWAEYIRDMHGIWKGENTESCITIQQANIRICKLSEIWTTAGNAWEKINHKNKFLSTKIFFSNSKDLLNVYLSLKIKNTISKIQYFQYI